MRAKLVVPFLFLIASLIGADELRIGVFVHTPNVSMQTGTEDAEGPSINYLKAVIAEMGHTASIRVMPLTRILKGLESGELDGSIDIVKTPEREKFLYYPENPALIYKPSLTVLAESRLTKVTSVGELSGLKIGYLKGASAGTFFENARGIRFELISGDTWVRQILAMLIAGRVDAALDQNAYSYLAEAKRQGLENRIRVIDLPGKGTGFYVVFSKKSPNAPLWLEQYNAVSATGIHDEGRSIAEFLNTK